MALFTGSSEHISILRGWRDEAKEWARKERDRGNYDGMYWWARKAGSWTQIIVEAKDIAKIDVEPTN